MKDRHEVCQLHTETTLNKFDTKAFYIDLDS